MTYGELRTEIKKTGPLYADSIYTRDDIMRVEVKKVDVLWNIKDAPANVESGSTIFIDDAGCRVIGIDHSADM